jgi:hypothetical protein
MLKQQLSREKIEPQFPSKVRLGIMHLSIGCERIPTLTVIDKHGITGRIQRIYLLSFRRIKYKPDTTRQN